MDREGLMLRAVCGDRPVGVCDLDEGPVSIGRWEGASLSLNDPGLLPVHAVLDPEGNGRWRLISLSSEGCSVNGKRVRRAIVSPGDRLQIGEYEFVFHGRLSSFDSNPPPFRPAMVRDEAAARPLPMAPIPRMPTSTGPALKAVLKWRGTPLDAAVIAPGEQLTVGLGDDVTFQLPDALLQIGSDRGDKPTRWVAMAPVAGKWHVALDTPLRALDLATGGRPILTTDTRVQGPAAAKGFAESKLWVPMPEGTFVRLDAGELSIDVEPCSAFAIPKVAKQPKWSTPEGTRSIIVAMVFAFIALIVANPPPMAFRPPDQRADMLEAMAAYKPVAPPAPEKIQPKFTATNDPKELAANEGGAKAEGEQGKMGRPDATTMKAKSTGPLSDAEVVKQNKLMQMLNSGALNNALAGGAQDTVSRLGGLEGPAGEQNGVMGLSDRGLGNGGGGKSNDTVGVAMQGSKFGTGLANAGKVEGGRGLTDLGGDDTGDVSGGLDREVIRRVILSHRAQIRYCYEKELSTQPDLAGKVNIEFVIGADGKVTTARPVENTLASPAVGQCITSKVKTWTFPQPKGGGVVVVTYPFLFKPAGQGAE